MTLAEVCGDAELECLGSEAGLVAAGLIAKLAREHVHLRLERRGGLEGDDDIEVTSKDVEGLVGEGVLFVVAFGVNDGNDFERLGVEADLEGDQVVFVGLIGIGMVAGQHFGVQLNNGGLATLDEDLLRRVEDQGIGGLAAGETT
jgi:hypothetical protein